MANYRCGLTDELGSIRVEENQKHFDKEAPQVDANPQFQEGARDIARAMRVRYPSLFNKEETTVMDFACGTGLVSREISPHVKSLLGVDVSQGMVDQFNLRVSDQGVPLEEIKATRAELKGDGTELDGQKFDLVICTAAYHHFANVEEITRILASFLKPGGSLLVVDILYNETLHTDPDLPEHFHQVVAHKNGFSEAEMLALFEQGGLGAFEFTEAVTQIKILTKEANFFLAKGIKV
ncbi:hypothetical protein EW026_g8114 [Hermanssonia centrifuga]|uniref:Methyltransferase domain-containing protein n=1 Tax=Hermanssonia centrifuga TaxID=98765 RepID=A0A4S4K5I1_9APHY|nr:hypothetical protein EW026_g8114 [Hermanssonia centrifuga]